MDDDNPARRYPPEPRATYRLQLTPSFTLRHARGVVDHLHALGVSHLYLSPVTAATPGSQHGYDVTDGRRLNPELGTEEDFADLARAARERGMGILLDVVPNHAAAHHANPAWWDVLRLGRESSFADWFDVDWGPDPARPAPVVLPVLGDAPEAAVERRELRLTLHRSQLAVAYHDHRLPLDPRTTAGLAARVAVVGEAIGAGPPGPHAGPSWIATWRALMEALPAASGDPRDLAVLHEAAPAMDAALAAALHGAAETRLAFDAALGAVPADEVLALLGLQRYVASPWKDGLARINYRRFFDVSGLVAVRTEHEPAREAGVGWALSALRRGLVHGLRIDHVDGLHDPGGYLAWLRTRSTEAAQADDPSAAAPLLLVEKILASEETLPDAWPVDGTTGYESLNRLGALFVHPDGLREIEAHARAMLGLPGRFDESAAAGKRLVLERLFPSEMGRLAGALSPLAAAAGAPSSEADLRAAIIGATAWLRVYRTYIGSAGPTEEDRRRLDDALGRARDAGGADAGALGALRRTLLGDLPDGARADALAFTRRWQQLTGPAAAKGVEDTALYRHVTLLSLSEVGGEPSLPDDPVAVFHAGNARTLARHPASLTATSTHDTKRSEDARARLNVLSEIPGEWTRAVDRWRDLNAPHRAGTDGRPIPALRDELAFYQSLIAAWPATGEGAGGLVDRLKAAALKAAREAKAETSWTNPDAGHESALTAFVERSLRDPGGRFLSEVSTLLRRIAPAGAVNSLGQTVLKCVGPGTPDVYQGQELWDFSLVDPDNRRPVDFAARRAISAEPPPATPAGAAALLTGWRSGRIKLAVLRGALLERAARPRLYAGGEYLPLGGAGHQPLMALARRLGRDWSVALVPRFPMDVLRPEDDPPTAGALSPRIDARRWAASRSVSLTLPPDAPERWRHAFTGETITAAGGRLDVADLLGRFPVALLTASVHAPSVPPEP